MGQMIMLKNVRCSYPQVHGPEVNNGETYPPNITLLLDPSKDQAILAEIQKAIAAEVQGNDKLRKNPPSPDKRCLRKGEREEYTGMLILKANNQKKPLVLNADKTVADKETCKIYSGCYVNAKVDIWGYAGQYGRRVSAKLLAVQFAKDGESFDDSYVSDETAAEGFESLADNEFSDSPNPPGTADINEFL